MDKLEVGDEIMADKGFEIQDLLAPIGVRLNIPPFLSSSSQFSSEDVVRTKKLLSCEYMLRELLGESKNSVSCVHLFVPLCGTLSMK